MTSPDVLDGLARSALDLLVDLVRAACVNDLTPASGHEADAAAILERFFAGAPVELRRIEPAPGRVSLIATLRGTDPDAEPLTLLGHTDVVPADAGAWSRDPFAAEICDGVIWGRGVVDMLHLTASMAAVLKDLALSGERLAAALARRGREVEVLVDVDAPIIGVTGEGTHSDAATRLLIHRDQEVRALEGAPA